MRSSRAPDLLVANARVLTLDPRHPTAESIAIRNGRIRAVGSADDLRDMAGTETLVLDAGGGLAVPAFHDAHCHLLAWARFSSALDCRHLASMGDLQKALARWSRDIPDGGWTRGNGYDEALLGRHPDRHDLDAAVADRPIRLQHRSLHLDVLNSRALQLTGLLDLHDSRVERDPLTHEPTGRLFNAGLLLQRGAPRPSYDSIATDIRRASQRLLAWGVTTVQDASFTNGPDEWDLFHQLAADGHLRVRTVMLLGARYWRQSGDWREESRMVRRGPVKLMLNSAAADPAELRAELHDARRAGRAVAVHTTGEDELALALDGFCSAPRGLLPSPNRLEHASVVPQALMEDVRDLGLTVVGQPTLVHERGDVYRSEYAAGQHGWLHRARSWTACRVPYAAGSDAPVTEPNPLVGLTAARRRSTKSGEVLGPEERLSAFEALRAFTLGPAEAVGPAHELGRLQPGMVADVAILDPDALDLEPHSAAGRRVRATIMEGRPVWQRGSQ